MGLATRALTGPFPAPKRTDEAGALPSPAVVLRLDGEPRQAVISAASGCESLLDDLLCCLLWEEGERPEDWSQFFNQSLTQRVRSGSYAARLKGSWTFAGDGPIARWFGSVRGVRNRVVHGGDEPTTAEAVEAMASALELTNFIVDRLRHRVSKYPRTAWMAGAPAFLSNRSLNRHVLPLTEDPREPPWRQTARRWEWVMHQGTDDGAWSQRDPAQEAHHLVAVKHATGAVVWAFATESGRASRIGEPVGCLSKEHLDGIARLEVPEHLPAINVELVREPSSTHPLPPPSGPWVAAYHLVPGGPVMVTGEALDPP